MMNKTILAIAVGTLATSGMAMAEDLKADAYIGAELGGNFLVGDEAAQGDGTFAADNMIKVGAEISQKVAHDVNVFVGTEVRFGMEGTDSDWTNNKYDGDSSTEIHRFSVGADTVAGRSEFGILEGMADTTDEFADLSMEHGLNAAFDGAINGENTLEHTFTNELLTATASYDFSTEAYHVGGTVKAGQIVTLGGAYVDSGEDVDQKAYTLGAVADLGQFAVAAKYIAEEGDDADDNTGYGVSGSYSLNEKVNFAASYNSINYDESFMDDDDFFTVGASYAVSKNIELVTDYKFASEVDDQVFVRANINF